MNNAEDYLVEILEYYIHRLKSKSCTMDEMNNVLRTIEENMDISGTIDNFSDFYKVPQSSVRATISRKLIAKPKRKLLYPFLKFVKIVPEKWRKR